MTTHKKNINIYNYLNNIKNLQILINNSHPRTNNILFLMMKGHAYGHGLELAKHLPSSHYLATATIEEAQKLRAFNIKANILLLYGISDTQLKDALNLNTQIMISSLHKLKKLNQQAKTLNKILHIHLMINTGTNRLGINPESLIPTLIELKTNLKNTKLIGISSHFSEADGYPSKSNQKRCKTQFQIYLTHIEKAISQNLIDPQKTIFHIENSSAVLREKELDLTYPSHFQNLGFRIGHLAFGLNPFKSIKIPSIYRPVFESWETKILNIQFNIKANTYIGYGKTSPAGYKTHQKSIVCNIPVGFSNGIQRYPIMQKNAKIILKNKKSILAPIAYIHNNITGLILPQTKYFQSQLQEGNQVLLIDSYDSELNIYTISQHHKTIPSHILTQIK